MSNHPYSTKNLYFRLFDVRPRKGDLRKFEILEASMEVFRELGLDRANFVDIGKKLKIRRSHIAYYFPDRESLILACIEYAIGTGQEITIERIRRSKTPLQQLKGYIQGTFDWCEEHPSHAALLVAFYSTCLYDRKSRELHTEIRRAGRERVKAILREIFPEGRNKSELDRIGQAIQTLVLGGLTEYLTCDTGLSSEAFCDRIYRSSMSVLGAHDGRAGRGQGSKIALES